MDMASGLTTRAKLWSDRMPETPPRWIDRGDGFNVKFDKDESRPLHYVKTLAAQGNGVVVDLYESTNIQETVAIKFFETSSNQERIDLVNKEVELLRSIRHYHCIQALGSFTLEDRLGIITQPAAACDLKNYLLEYDSFKTRNFVKEHKVGRDFLPRLMGCLAHGLHYIHERKSEDGAQVRHRDIKPSNILLHGYRVLFADFGISKVYTDTTTGTRGSSDKTPMYASPERAGDEYRNIACDIFSLGCVFAEIFTVYKGKSAEEFLAYRKQKDVKDKERNGYFHNTVPQVLDRLDSLVTERCDVQIVSLIRGMMSIKPTDRPTAKQAWETLTICTTGSESYFCGSCCMPLHPDDPLLGSDAHPDPSRAEYATSESTPNVSPLPDDLHFKVKYALGKGPRVKWVRNLRHWDHATLDVVRSESSAPHARKRIFLQGNAHGRDRATNEAAILREVKHRHIVILRSTYKNPKIMTLHFKPAADFDLRSFLGLIELRMIRNRGHPKDSQLEKDLDLLAASFGCLSGALAEIHEHGYDHGEIRPENILVHDHRIYISKFSLGLKCGRHTRGSSSDDLLHRFINVFGAMDLGILRSHSAKDLPPDTLSPGVSLYKPPEWNPKPSDVGHPPADVFSLGCVFTEIHRVLTGGRTSDFEAERAKAGTATYWDILSKTQDFVSSIKEKEYETKERFLSMVRSMLAQDSRKRPTAKAVYHTMKSCKTFDGRPRCGSCPPPGQA